MECYSDSMGNIIPLNGYFSVYQWEYYNYSDLMGY